MLKRFLPAASALFLTACLGDPIVENPEGNPPVENPGDQAAALNGVTWVLVSVERPGEAAIAVDGDDYTIRFDSTGHFYGQVNCNTFGGAYSTKDSIVTADEEIWVTAVGCEDPYGDDVLAFIGKDPSVYEVTGDTLCLSNKKGHKTCFVAAPEVPEDALPYPINPGLACGESPSCLFSDADSSHLSAGKKAWFRAWKPSQYETRARLARVDRSQLLKQAFILNLFPDIKPKVYATSISRLPPQISGRDSTLLSWLGMMEGESGEYAYTWLSLAGGGASNDPFDGNFDLRPWYYTISRVENNLVLIVEFKPPLYQACPPSAAVLLPKHAGAAAVSLTCANALP